MDLKNAHAGKKNTNIIEKYNNSFYTHQAAAEKIGDSRLFAGSNNRDFTFYDCDVNKKIVMQKFKNGKIIGQKYGRQTKLAKYK